MPPRNADAVKEAKRRTVAKGVLQGKQTKTIAKEAGCSQRHVQRLAAEPETQFIIKDAMRPQLARLRKMMAKAVGTVDNALVARHKDLRADHFTRLRAVERLGDLLELAQGKPTEEQEASSGLITWEEFQILYRKGTAEVVSQNHHTPETPGE